jgi:glycosyltransferase involved in cell wall biosynthesis
MKRVMHVITGLTTGGAEMMLFRLLAADKNNAGTAVVSLMDAGTIGPRIAALDIPLYCLGMNRGRPGLVRGLSIFSLARRLRPQLIVGWMYHGNLMASLARMCLSSPGPVFWNIQQALDDIDGWGRLTASVIRIGARLSWSPAAIIYNTRVGARQHEAVGYWAAKSVVIPAGFDCSLFHPDPLSRNQVRAQLGVGENTVLIGLVARYHPMKDHLGFLRAAALVARQYSDVRFALIGQGTSEQPALLSVLAEEGLTDKFLLLGERFDTPRLTAAFDIACSASAWGEGFSNAVGEAMASAVPCVVTDVGDSAYAIGNTGLSVPPRNPQALATAISSLIQAGPTHRSALGAAARQRIESEFSISAISCRYHDLYRQHLENTG